LPKKRACPLIEGPTFQEGDLWGLWQPEDGSNPPNKGLPSFQIKRRDNGGIKTMAADRAQNLQDTFLNHVRKTKTPLTIFLVNGVKLQGIVTWFDNFCLLLRRDGHSQLVYKHAISTIMPGAPIQLFEGGEDAPA
jgi:host factor-I protein